MTHRIVVNVETGVTSIVEYTAEEQAIHDAAVAAQAAEAQALAETQVDQQTVVSTETIQTPQP